MMTTKTDYIESRVVEIVGGNGLGKPGSGGKFVQMTEEGIRRLLLDEHGDAVEAALKTGQPIYESWESDYPRLKRRLQREGFDLTQAQ
jgi:hypothetical protein